MHWIWPGGLKSIKLKSSMSIRDLTLKQIREDTESFIGSWNGEDDKFIHDGEIYHEADVHLGEEILEKLDELEELLNQ